MPRPSSGPHPLTRFDRESGQRVPVYRGGLPIYRARANGMEEEVAGYEAAILRQVELRAMARPPRAAPGRRLTFEDALVPYLTWYKVRDNGTMRPRSSVAGRAQALATYCKPHFGKWYLDEIDTPDLYAFLRNFKLVNKNIPAAGTKTTVQAALRGFFYWARVNSHVLKNPMKEVQLELGGHTQSKTLSISLWRAEEQARLMHELHPGYGFGDIVRVFAYTGLRWEELVAVPLDDEHVYRAGGGWMLKIAWTASESSGTREVRPDTKTKAGYRHVIVPKAAEQALLNLMARAYAGRERHPDRFRMLVNGVRGGYLSYSVWRKFLTRAKAVSTEPEPLYNAHDLRHVCASFLIGAGWKDKEIANQFGHAKVETVRNLYAHWIAMDTARLRALADSRIAQLFLDVPLDEEAGAEV